MSTMRMLPVIDVGPLVAAGASGPAAGPGEAAVAAEIHRACTESGFFHVVGHGVGEALQARLEREARAFFTLDVDTKMRIRMALAGRAWRGFFPVGDELTSGKPDVKEGLYFGEELPASDARVAAGTPLHGANLFPDEVPGLRHAVLDYMAALTDLGHALMRGVALGLALPADHFRTEMMASPLTLFRIFHYPPTEPIADDRWGVGEHTDYGVLTILKQDDVGGLQVRTGSTWIDAPPLPGSFVCNIGDMLDRLTRGVYRSTPHRVRNASGRGRYSFPFFFDPGWDARVEALDVTGLEAREDDRATRWDRTSVHDFGGTYGEYVLGKVAKVFPELGESAI
jgi:isopenicillin N synthase-like dioxygenase